MAGSLFEWKIPSSFCLPSRESMLSSLNSREDDSAINCIVPMLSACVKAQGGFRIIPMSISENSIHLDTISCTVGSILSGAFTDAGHVALFVATIGPLVEKEAEKYVSQGEMYKGYVTDIYGSLAVENAADFIHARVNEYAEEQGISSGNRYSPGYCGWNVSDQHSLFSLLPHNFCGVQLADSSMMQPVKSVSGMIPLGKNVKKQGYTCDTCTNAGCFRKR
jgi:Vitamin B12 dependent methionine synthase, activation domain